MSWLEPLNGNPLPWLLEAGDPDVHYCTLRDLFDRPPDDPELAAARRAAHVSGPIPAILAHMDPQGWWNVPEAGYLPKYTSTVWSLILLAQLGASVHEDRRIERACQYLVDHALTEGGQFTSSSGPSGAIDCLQGNLCWALMELGYEHPRLESAYEWMAMTVTGDGIAPKEEKDAPVRYFAYKCGPTFACGANNKLPCAWGGCKVMMAFGKLSTKKQTPLVKKSHQTRCRLLPRC